MKLHWIEAAEQHANEEPERLKKHLVNKSERVRKNFIAHENDFMNALHAMESLINRANQITNNHRKGISLIGFKSRKTKNEDIQHFYASSRIIGSPRLLGLIPLYSGKVVKHYRRIQLSMSDRQGMVRLEFKQNVRLRTPLGERQLRFSMIFKRKYTSHILVYFPVLKLNQELFYDLLDWLAFSAEILDCPYLMKHKYKMKILTH